MTENVSTAHVVRMIEFVMAQYSSRVVRLEIPVRPKVIAEFDCVRVKNIRCCMVYRLYGYERLRRLSYHRILP